MNGFSDLSDRYLTEFTQIACLGLYVKPTGSRVTESGWTDESDYDFVILDRDKKLAHLLSRSNHWELGGSGNGSEFSSFKKVILGITLNFILVDSEEVFRKYCSATEVIKMMNCKTKEERIKVFNMVFGGTPETEAVPF